MPNFDLVGRNLGQVMRNFDLVAPAVVPVTCDFGEVRLNCDLVIAKPGQVARNLERVTNNLDRVANNFT